MTLELMILAINVQNFEGKKYSKSLNIKGKTTTNSAKTTFLNSAYMLKDSDHT
jgi:stalled ribosome rescue protein Dom34